MDKDTWWWDDGMQEVTRKKKGLFKKWQGSNYPEDREAYGAAKRVCRKAVATARSKSLAPAEEQLFLSWRVPGKKLHGTSTKGKLLYDAPSIKERACTYYAELSNKQHPHNLPPEPPPNLGLISPFFPEETHTRMALHHMKNRKLVGPDNVPIEVWKVMGSHGVDLDLFNRFLIIPRKC
ncbi:hypothetical protein PYW07_013928 [Mythimna separata]|uniref:Uncharacterized protein n=1 Tax=Mythimna separata TaxID=271217 RepID=A0AAD7YFP2_MYTSE|nr:hypothetical protein PYW07_013928 [Mythimna separata]